MYKNILIPVDGSPPSMRGLEEAVKLAKSERARLHVLHIVNELVFMNGDIPELYDVVVQSLREGGKAILERASAYARQHDVEPKTYLVERFGGRASDQIVDQIKAIGADLIIMGTHGRRGVSRLTMGSDAELVVRSSPVPVLLVKSSDASAG
jgi:nucleotide-binding universal stress UspA family protein